ncbi:MULTISPECIES: GGDEF domain-containing protein [Sporosarcina]|uniref:GGDEF domain-containing protein n=1 Tax=Sporosarcina TaxID=1569 RepID=UPI00058AFA59|nr:MULTISPECIES: GGDEF domain-containing protein [Sporosarcina]WJY26221.1 GGDEF domain-containing protein [Sporosarcina sp. 0.2-SM1T-5]
MRETIQRLQRTIESLQHQGKFEEMIECCYQLLQAATDMGDHHLRMEAYANYALGFYRLGAIKEAFQYIGRHANLCETWGTKEDYMHSNHIFCLLYVYTGDYERAKQVLEMSIDLAEQLGNSRLISENSSELCNVLCRLGEYDRALKAGRRGASVAADLEPYCPYLLLKAALASAHAYYGLEDMESSAVLLEIVQRDPLLDTYPAERVKSIRLKAEIQLRQRHPRNAMASLEEASRMAEASSDHKQLKEILERQVSLAEHFGDFKHGFSVQRRYIRLLEELHEKEVINAVLQLDMKVKLRELEKQVNTDFLTGIANRRSVEDLAGGWLAESAGSAENIVCIAFDIDNLKVLNDRFGHPFGDQAIRKVADLCSSLMRKGDTTARIGGDEFVAVLRDITLQDGCRRAHDMLEAVRSALLPCNGENVMLSISAGVAENRRGSISDFAKLYHKADIALYEAKRSGKSRVICTS